MSFGGDSPFDIFVPSGERSFENQYPHFYHKLEQRYKKQLSKMEQRI